MKVYVLYKCKNYCNLISLTLYSKMFQIQGSFIICCNCNSLWKRAVSLLEIYEIWLYYFFILLENPVNKKKKKEKIPLGILKPVFRIPCIHF